MQNYNVQKYQAIPIFGYFIYIKLLSSSLRKILDFRLYSCTWFLEFSVIFLSHLSYSVSLIYRKTHFFYERINYQTIKSKSAILGNL